MFPFSLYKFDVKNLFLFSGSKKENSKSQKIAGRAFMDKVKKTMDTKTEDGKDIAQGDVDFHAKCEDNKSKIIENSNIKSVGNINSLENKKDDGFDFSFEHKKSDLEAVLNKKVINLNDLRRVTWGGMPKGLRAKCWRIFLKTVNLNNDNYHSEIVDKDRRYKELKQNIFKIDEKIKHQIKIDIVRIEKSQKNLVVNGILTDMSEIFENILTLYAHQRPAVGYVQGIADILVPFLKTFYQEENENLSFAESSAYWCFTRFIDNLQENYINFQTGIKNNMRLMKGIVELLEPHIVRHMMNIGLEFHMFTFRWFNCHFTREFSDEAVLAIFDTMLSTSVPKKIKVNNLKNKNLKTQKNTTNSHTHSEFKANTLVINSGYTRELDFAHFALFFAISFFISLKKELLNCDFADCMFTLQKTNRKISVKDLQILMASAYVNENIFDTRNK